jgi:hypothetical protein
LLLAFAWILARQHVLLGALPSLEMAPDLPPFTPLLDAPSPLPVIPDIDIELEKTDVYLESEHVVVAWTRVRHQLKHHYTAIRERLMMARELVERTRDTPFYLSPSTDIAPCASYQELGLRLRPEEQARYVSELKQSIVEHEKMLERLSHIQRFWKWIVR